NVAQGNDPLFVPRGSVLQQRLRQLELDNVLRDPSDRISGVDMLTLALGNRLYVAAPPGEKGLTEPPRLFADATLSASWDFANSNGRDLFFDGIMYATEHWRTRVEGGWDFEHAQLSEALIEFAYADDVGNDLGIAYRKVRDVPAFFEDYKIESERF